MVKKRKKRGNRPGWAARLEGARAFTRLNQTEFGKLIGASQQSVSYYESGENEPDIATWLLISEVTGKTVDEIMRGTGAQDRHNPPKTAKDGRSRNSDQNMSRKHNGS